MLFRVLTTPPALTLSAEYANAAKILFFVILPYLLKDLVKKYINILKGTERSEVFIFKKGQRYLQFFFKE